MSECKGRRREGREWGRDVLSHPWPRLPTHIETDHDTAQAGIRIHDYTRASKAHRRATAKEVMMMSSGREEGMPSAPKQPNFFPPPAPRENPRSMDATSFPPPPSLFTIYPIPLGLLPLHQTGGKCIVHACQKVARK